MRGLPFDFDLHQNGGVKQTTTRATTEADPYGMTNKKDNSNYNSRFPSGMTSKKSNDKCDCEDKDG